MNSTEDSASQHATHALRSLIAFATARSYSVNTNNPLNSILPLFEPIAATLHGRQFIAADLSRELRERYDLIVSEELCNHWSSQLIQRKLLIPIERTGSSGGYEWSQERVSNIPDGAFAEELVNLLSSLRKFSSESGDLITQSMSDDQLVTLLRRGAIASMFPRLHSGNNHSHNSEDEYIFSRFISHLRSTNLSALDSISRLRRAVIYSDLILHLREPRKPSNNSQFVFAYFDSPLVMDLIGLGGKLRRSFAERLVKSLAEMKVIPLVSPVMIEEARGNIRALIGRDPRDRFGPTADALRRTEFTIDFVEACFDRLEALIESAGLQIDKNFDSYLKPKYDSDGKNLEGELVASLQSHYRIFGAAERDAESLIGCFGRRDGVIPRDMYSSRCFFVTSNTMLAAIGNRFFRNTQSYTEKTFPIVVTRSTLAAMADAVSGIESKGSMSEQELIVSAADATSYDPHVFDKIENILKALTPNQADDLGSILQRTDMSELAMDLVRGNPANVTAQRVSEIADNVINKLEAEAEARVAAGVTKERAAAKEQAEILVSEVQDREARIVKLSEAAHRQHEIAVRIISTVNQKAGGVVRKSRMIIGVGAAIVGLTIGLATYLLALFSNNISDLGKVMLALVAALGAGIPPMGFPPLRAYLGRRIEAFAARSVRLKAVELGYDFEDQHLLEPLELVDALDEQFSSVAQLSGLKRPMSGLFDKTD